MITTAVILARGLGTRMRAAGGEGLSDAQAAAAASGHKALMPIGEHRLIDYALTSMADAGVTRVVLVVAPEHEAFSAHLEELAPKRLAVELAVQDEPLGTAHAVAAAEEAVGEASFILANGDNLYPVSAIEALRAQQAPSLVGFERAALIEHSNIPEDRIAAFALIEQEGTRLARLTEKPSAEVVSAAGPDALVSMNLMAFTPDVFAVCRSLELSPRGEYEVVDALGRLGEVTVVPSAGGVLDLSRRDDIADVEHRLETFTVSV